jgi:hypothetical protein
MSKRVLSIVAVLILAGGARPSEACKCLEPALGTAIKSADLVFWGEITEIAASRDAPTAITVSVSGVWKGDVPATAKVFTTASSCGLVTAGARVGRRFLFVAKLRDGEPHVRQCDGSRLATAAVRAAVDKIAGPAR